MKHKYFYLIVVLGITGLLTAVTITTYAATFISVISGPTWGNDGPYTATICTNTELGETVRVQTTIDGSSLTGNINTNPTSHISWNGTINACTFDQFEPVICGGAGSGEGTWICTFNDTPNSTINYRFIVTNQSGDWYGQQTGGSLNTGPTAVSLQTISASSQFTGLFITVLTLLLLIISSAWLRWRKQ